MFYILVASQPRPGAPEEHLETVPAEGSFTWIALWLTAWIPWLNRRRQDVVIRALEQANFTTKYRPTAGSMPLKAMVRFRQFKFLFWTVEETMWHVVFRLRSEGTYEYSHPDHWYFRH